MIYCLSSSYIYCRIRYCCTCIFYINNNYSDNARLAIYINWRMWMRRTTHTILSIKLFQDCQITSKHVKYNSNGTFSLRPRHRRSTQRKTNNPRVSNFQIPRQGKRQNEISFVHFTVHVLSQEYFFTEIAITIRDR